MAEHTNSRMWRCSREKVQPFYHYEIGNVVVGPSKVHGLGVFAQKDFVKGEVLGWYSGKCVKCGISDSKYMLEVDCFNNTTHTLEKWHLDSKHWYNSCMRWVNDSVGTLWQGIYNVRWCPRLSKEPHPVYETYVVEIIATADIKKGEELLIDYGAAYWDRFRNYKGLDPEIPTGPQYKHIMQYI